MHPFPVSLHRAIKLCFSSLYAPCSMLHATPPAQPSHCDWSHSLSLPSPPLSVFCWGVESKYSTLWITKLFSGATHINIFIKEVLCSQFCYHVTTKPKQCSDSSSFLFWWMCSGLLSIPVQTVRNWPLTNSDTSPHERQTFWNLKVFTLTVDKTWLLQTHGHKTALAELRLQGRPPRPVPYLSLE